MVTVEHKQHLVAKAWVGAAGAALQRTLGTVYPTSQIGPAKYRGDRRRRQAGFAVRGVWVHEQSLDGGVPSRKFKEPTWILSASGFRSPRNERASGVSRELRSAERALSGKECRESTQEVEE